MCKGEKVGNFKIFLPVQTAIHQRGRNKKNSKGGCPYSTKGFTKTISLAIHADYKKRNMYTMGSRSCRDQDP